MRGWRREEIGRVASEVGWETGLGMEWEMQWGTG